MQSDPASMIDALIPEIDKALRAVFAPASSRRAMPGADLPEAEMSVAEKRHVAALMRVNHCGEICAQALCLWLNASPGRWVSASDSTVCIFPPRLFRRSTCCG